MMTITTTSDFSGVNSLLAGILASTHDPHQGKLIFALNLPSPVDRIVSAMEAAYAAVLQDTALTGAALTAVGTAAGQLAFWVTNYQWHGKADRAAQILVAMNSVVGGTAPSALTGNPDVDEAFASPPPAPAAPVGA